MGTLIVEKKTTMSELNKLPAPVPATKFHKPIPHFQAVTAVLDELETERAAYISSVVEVLESDPRAEEI